MGFDPANLHFAAGFRLGLSILREQQSRAKTGDPSPRPPPFPQHPSSPSPPPSLLQPAPPSPQKGQDWRALQRLLEADEAFLSLSPESWLRTPDVYRQVGPRERDLY